MATGKGKGQGHNQRQSLSRSLNVSTYGAVAVAYVGRQGGRFESISGLGRRAIGMYGYKRNWAKYNTQLWQVTTRTEIKLSARFS